MSNLNSDFIIELINVRQRNKSVLEKWKTNNGNSQLANSFLWMKSLRVFGPKEWNKTCFSVSNHLKIGNLSNHLIKIGMKISYL